MFTINILAVIVAALAAFILGFLFHGPITGKLWMKLADIHPTGNEKLSDMIPQMIWNLISNLVMTLGVAVIYAFAVTSPSLSDCGLWGAVLISLIVWLGFLVTSSSIEVIWMGRKAKLWLFESACSLVVMFVVGVIIGAWR